MHKILFLGILDLSISNRNGADGFAHVEGYTFYRIKTYGKMTNANVRKVCAENGLITPCFTGTYDAFNDDKCKVVFPTNVTVDADTMQFIAMKTCGHRNPDKCILLQDIFVYMVNWVEDWACGTLNDQYCGYGEQYVNKWSLCASRDDGNLI